MKACSFLIFCLMFSFALHISSGLLIPALHSCVNAVHSRDSQTEETRLKGFLSSYRVFVLSVTPRCQDVFLNQSVQVCLPSLRAGQRCLTLFLFSPLTNLSDQGSKAPHRLQSRLRPLATPGNPWMQNKQNTKQLCHCLL